MKSPHPHFFPAFFIIFQKTPFCLEVQGGAKQCPGCLRFVFLPLLLVISPLTQASWLASSQILLFISICINIFKSIYLYILASGSGHGTYTRASSHYSHFLSLILSYFIPPLDLMSGLLTSYASSAVGSQFAEPHV